MTASVVTGMVAAYKWYARVEADSAPLQIPVRTGTPAINNLLERSGYRRTHPPLQMLAGRTDPAKYSGFRIAAEPPSRPTLAEAYEWTVRRVVNAHWLNPDHLRGLLRNRVEK